MSLLHKRNRFLFYFVLLTLGFVKCIRDEDPKTHYSTDDEDEDDTYMIAAYVFVIAIMITLVFLVIFSIVFIVAGLVISGQWPQPNFCCWTSPRNDRSSRCCCSLYQTNISLAVIWLMLFVFMLLSNVWQLIVLSAALVILHCVAAMALHRQFQKLGWPTVNLPAYPSQVVVMNNTGTGIDGRVLCTPQHPIPFVTAYINPSANSITVGQIAPNQDAVPRSVSNPTNQIL